VAAGLHPTTVTVDPSGKFAYTVNESSSNFSVYTIGTDGALTELLGGLSPVAAGSYPDFVTVDPSGKFVYAAGWSGKILVYTIDQATGALIAGTAVAAGSNPICVTTTGVIQ
jgi:6-phosphogluconolactonase (cycloisomerase 2 family)